MSVLLEVSGLGVRFGGLDALRGVSLDVGDDALVGLIGPNGSGKTTLFNAISGFVTPISGSVRLGGVNLIGSPPHERAGLGLARTFQAVAVYPQLSVLENVLVGAHLGLREERFARAVLGLPSVRGAERAMTEDAMRLLRQLDLAEWAGVPAGDLPFGKQRSIELARALIAKPRLLLLDEPASGLDSTETEELRGLLERIRAEHSLTMFVIDHDMSFLLGLVEYVFVLNFGSVIARGEPDEIRRDPVVLEAYLGQEAVGALG